MIIGDAKDVLGAAGARADEVIVGTGSSAVTVWESFTWHVLSPGAGEAQDQIASIVRSHGDDPESVTSFRNYGFDFANMTNSYRAFYVFSYLESVNLRNTQNLTITDGMFYGCSNLVEIPPMDWSKVTSSSGAFGFCGSLSSVILNGMKSSFLVSNTSMSAAALNALFESLGTAAREQQVNAASTPGAGSANTGILHGKNWIARTGGLAFTDTFNRGNGTPGSGYSYAGLRPDIWDNRVGGGYNSGAMKAGTMTLSGQSITTNRYRITMENWDISPVYPMWLYMGTLSSTTLWTGVGIRVQAGSITLLRVADGGQTTIEAWSRSLERGETYGISYDEADDTSRVWINGVSSEPYIMNFSGRSPPAKSAVMRFQSSGSGSSTGVDTMWFEDI